MSGLMGIRITENSATMIMPGGKPVTIPSNHHNFEELSEKLMSGEYTMEEIEELIKPPAARVTANGQVINFEIKYGEAYYKGRKIDNRLGKKLVEEIERGNPMPGFLNFAEKLLQNPSRTAVDELYLFLDSGYVALHQDGDFLAYKKVRGDFKDIYTGTMDNSPGKTVEMARNEVDDVRDRTCSSGLHFCSYDYLNHYGSSGNDKVVLVKINPADVVSIPSDYSNTKGRTCRYTVLQEVSDWQTRNYLDEVDVAEEFYDDEDDDLDYDWNDDE